MPPSRLPPEMVSDLLMLVAIIFQMISHLPRK